MSTLLTARRFRSQGSSATTRDTERILRDLAFVLHLSERVKSSLATTAPELPWQDRIETDPVLVQ